MTRAGAGGSSRSAKQGGQTHNDTSSTEGPKSRTSYFNALLVVLLDTSVVHGSLQKVQYGVHESLFPAGHVWKSQH